MENPRWNRRWNRYSSYIHGGAVYTRFSIHRTFRKQTPGFRVAFGAVVGATEISGIRRFPFLKDASKRTKLVSTGGRRCAGRGNESVTWTWSYRPLLGRAPAAVTLATHVHFLLHRKGRVSPRRGAVCATRPLPRFSSLALRPSTCTLLMLASSPRQNFHRNFFKWKCREPRIDTNFLLFPMGRYELYTSGDICRWIDPILEERDSSNEAK